MAREYTKGFVRKHYGVWQAVVCWQEDGKQFRISKSTNIECVPNSNRGKGAAEDFLRRWRDELVLEASQENAFSSSTPFIEYVSQFIKVREGNGKVEDTTLRTYYTHKKRLMGTALGDMPIKDITYRDIEDFEQDLLEEGLSSSTRSHIHVFLKQVLEKARRSGDLVANPFDLVDAPRRERKPINALDMEGIKKLNKKLSEYEESPFKLAVRIALMTGMRQGEICALRWRDVDEKRREIHVTHSLKRVSGRYKLGSPKTENSIRTIPYGNELAKALETRRKAAKAECAELDAKLPDDAYVIGSPIDGRFYSPQVLGKNWHTFSRICGLKGTQNQGVRFHDLRHTFATHAIASGQDVKTVSAILGHANAAMTLNIYSDALADSKRTSMDMLDSVFSAV